MSSNLISLLLFCGFVFQLMLWILLILSLLFFYHSVAFPLCLIWHNLYFFIYSSVLSASFGCEALGSYHLFVVKHCEVFFLSLSAIRSASLSSLCSVWGSSSTRWQLMKDQTCGPHDTKTTSTDQKQQFASIAFLLQHGCWASGWRRPLLVTLRQDFTSVIQFIVRSGVQVCLMHLFRLGLGFTIQKLLKFKIFTTQSFSSRLPRAPETVYIICGTLDTKLININNN